LKVISFIFKVLYFCAVIAILLSGLRIDQGIAKREFENVGKNINEGYYGETVVLEYEYIDMDLFYHEVDLYHQGSKIYVQGDGPEVCLDDEDDWVNTSYIASVYLSDEIYRNFDIGGVLILLAYVTFLIVIPFAVCIYSFKTKRNAKKEAVRKNIDEYYNKCLSLKIYGTDKKDDQEKLLLVAKNFGYTTLEQAIKNYRKGQEQAKTYNENNKKAKLAEEQKKDFLAKQEIEKKREEERQEYVFEKTRSEKTGKRKYISIIEEKIKSKQAEYKEIEKIDEFAPFKHHKKDNWGWAGGIAEGIAGPGAGVIAASMAHEETVNYNNAVDKYNTSLIENGYDPGAVMDAKRKKLKGIEGEINKLKEYADAIQKTLINDDCMESDFGKLRFTVVGSLMEETLNLSLKVSVKVLEPITLLGQEAIIDGSVLIEVLDKNNRKVGEAYYNACDTKTYKLQKAGFNHSETRSVIAVPTNKTGFHKDEKYHYNVKPNAIWTIEIC